MKNQLMLVIKVTKPLVAILLFLPFITGAQVVSDAKLWTGVSVSKNINDLTISFSEEMRLDENVSHIDKIFSEIGAEYKVVKGLYAAVNYRFDRDNDYESRSYDITHRLDFGLTYKFKYNNFRFSYRTKLQMKTDHPTENNPTFNRNKLSVRYKMENPLSPFASYEFYYQFNDQNVINRSRISLGSKYEINENNSVKLFYMFENRFNTKNLKHNHVWGVSYSINL